jgi:sialate O-acetylesterase
MIIETGLFDGMVLQRDKHNLCAARFSGNCAGAGLVVARVTRGRGDVLKGFERKRAGAARGGVFRGRLDGLPAGGPYAIELRIEAGRRIVESVTVWDVLVGDVWLLGGQSNMEGIGLLKDAAQPRAQVRAFYMDDRWGVARDPIHNLGDAVDQVHLDINGGTPIRRDPRVGTGPGVAFGREMLRRTGVPQGLIACAHGGTSMQQWDPALKSLGGRSLYGAMLRRFRKNGGRVAGVVWYQGCSDAFNEGAARYTRRMRALVRALRRDFGDPALPLVAVQIAGVFMEYSFKEIFWNLIQDQQRRLPEVIRRCAVVPAVDLGYDDAIHISGQDQQRLGRRLAQAMAALRGDRRAGPPPIALRSATIEDSRVKIVFENVIGGLCAAGKPTGFTLSGPKPTNVIYRVEVRGNTVWLHTSATPQVLASLQLYYGYGLSAHCNITDAADRSLPVFGPLPLGVPLAGSEFVTTWRVSRALPSAGKLHGLDYPKDLPALRLRPREFAGTFVDLHLDLFRCAPEDRLVFLAARLDCPEKMRLGIGLGYDGPVKLWLDRKLRFFDPEGTNPAIVDKKVIPFQARAGRHEILVALGSNNGKAWGIWLRFLRRVSRRRAWALVAMPKVIG